MRLFEVKEQKFNSKLMDSFIMPPFSYLDTKSGHWQDRRRMWAKYIGDLTETRDDDFGKTFNITKDNLTKQTSTFDPVLAELMYRWFCIPNGKVLDPFGGEQTKGFIAGALGYRYRGVEIRQDQVDVNNRITKEFADVQYTCGNSCDMPIDEYDFDMCFTSPPYYDLEVYSDFDASALETYNQFMQNMKIIFENCYERLLDGTFTVIKVGEIRDKNGAFRGFVPDTVNMCKDIGWKYYNEIILLNSVGSGAVRAAGNMRSRKIVKLHQNVLVFYKGDISAISKKYPELRS